MHSPFQTQTKGMRQQSVMRDPNGTLGWVRLGCRIPVPQLEIAVVGSKISCGIAVIEFQQASQPLGESVHARILPFNSEGRASVAAE